HSSAARFTELVESISKASVFLFARFAPLDLLLCPRAGISQNLALEVGTPQIIGKRTFRQRRAARGGAARRRV
ncbi:MAG TPA: hypothetical protein VLY23_05795, partial [Candidatus Acidoferrum sp.]|nr:hypothetical protein [Candidatus Acidoferrum sp.]